MVEIKRKLVIGFAWIKSIEWNSSRNWTGGWLMDEHSQIMVTWREIIDLIWTSSNQFQVINQRYMIVIIHHWFMIDSSIE